MTPRKDRPPQWQQILTVAAIVVVWATSLMGAVWWTAADRTAALDQIEAAAVCIDDHEARLRALENQTAQIAADIRWIRQHMEKHLSTWRPAVPPPDT